MEKEGEFERGKKGKREEEEWKREEEERKEEETVCGPKERKGEELAITRWVK